MEKSEKIGNIRLGLKASKNAHKHYRRIAKIYAKIANQRRDLWQKSTTEISQKYTSHRRFEGERHEG